MILVKEKKRVPENCSTCLYSPNAIGWDGNPVGGFGCGCADRRNDWMRYCHIRCALPVVLARPKPI